MLIVEWNYGKNLINAIYVDKFIIFNYNYFIQSINKLLIIKNSAGSYKPVMKTLKKKHLQDY